MQSIVISLIREGVCSNTPNECQNRLVFLFYFLYINTESLNHKLGTVRGTVVTNNKIVL